MLLNIGHNIASLHLLYSCRSNHDSGFSRAISVAAADHALGAVWCDLCQSAAVPPDAEFPNEHNSRVCITQVVINYLQNLNLVT